MKTRYRILFFLIGIAGIVLLAVKAVPDKSDWGELFTPRLPLLLLGLFLLWVGDEIEGMLIDEIKKNIGKGVFTPNFEDEFTSKILPLL